ncbi:Asp-tRNA(Asn)/Glu-tRNA(Gln) amidotransferase GatCAB subunit A, partial [Candidatus Roizmanbacteria bacterium]|nr:Asp-tRNA(Asn)/Glu-tRNA(Gln) amidotransferase GatCAB subunit A [Candidatus Roizmanbacteria bacterium]
MNVLGKSLLELNELVEKKTVSTKELNAYFLKRIKKYNIKLNAFLTICENNEEGMPIAIKDVYCTRHIRTTAASKVLDQFIAPYDATVVRRLLDKKFGILGKTNMDAWCHGSSSETSDYGPPKNPWDLTRSPGGSSGGSACAVSSYLAPV